MRSFTVIYTVIFFPSTYKYLQNLLVVVCKDNTFFLNESKVGHIFSWGMIEKRFFPAIPSEMTQKVQRKDKNHHVF